MNSLTTLLDITVAYNGPLNSGAPLILSKALFSKATFRAASWQVGHFIPVSHQIRIVHANVHRLIISLKLNQMEIIVYLHLIDRVRVTLERPIFQIMIRKLILVVGCFHRDNSGKQAVADMVWKPDNCILGAIDKDTLAFMGSCRIVAVKIEYLLRVVEDGIHKSLVRY